MKKLDIKKIWIGSAAASILSVMPTLSAFGQAAFAYNSYPSFSWTKYFIIPLLLLAALLIKQVKWFVKALKHYADFRGRARRREFWMFTLFNVIFSCLWGAVILRQAGSLIYEFLWGGASYPYVIDNKAQLLIMLYVLYGLVLLLPSLAVAVRRLHDIGKSGWWYFIVLLPFIGSIWLFILLVTNGDTGDNEYGRDPKATPEPACKNALLKYAGILLAVVAIPFFFVKIFVPEAQYKTIYKFDEGLCGADGYYLVQIKGGKSGIVNKNFKVLIPCDYSFFGQCVNGVLVASKYVRESEFSVKTLKSGLVDMEGKEILPFEYEKIHQADGNSKFLILESKDKMGLYDITTKNIAYPPKYDEIGSFLDGLARVALDGKYGYIDENGRERIPCIYDEAAKHFANGIAEVSQNGEQFTIDKTGGVINRTSGSTEVDRSEQVDVTEGYVPYSVPDPISDSTPASEDEIYTVVDQRPEFPGGDAVMMQFIAKNLQYPAIAKENGIQGTVTCRFLINKDGSISDVEVLRSAEASLDKEAIRLIKSMPKWAPGKRNGKTVAVYYTLPVRFRIR
ncbi:MAG: TonB family protein [Dysgonamonadaceae bacterium]|jgi:protein TonB|nr:TonB family protein [Dysgonamonadaceae bacterium]